ncbi:class C sortase [Corynebacterium hindlerae]|uniref:class C sortase n=1 Tax=Corynebacterium hindlerae TaxID=699041 RepID=UPI0031B67529
MGKHQLVTEQRPARPRHRALVALLIALVSLAVMVYPVAVTYYNNTRQAKVAEENRAAQQAINPAERKMWLESARKYNEIETNQPILDPWLARVSKDNAPYRNYLDELAASDIMATLTIPSIKSELPIYHGTDTETLERGIGHLYGSALPVGGEGTHSVLTGHTGLTSATLFDRLDKVAVGDAFFIDVMGETLKYEVESIEIVLPEETESLAAQPGRDLVTLITCTPYAVNTHRLLVHGQRVPYDPVKDADYAGKIAVWQTWMWVVVAIVVLALAVITFLILRGRTQRRRNV